MATFVYCTCGARYSRVETKAPVPVKSVIACALCGVTLEKSTRDTVPTYALLRRPEAKSA